MPNFTLSRRSAHPILDFPTAEISFAADGTPTDPDALGNIKAKLSRAGVTDLFVLCGGWADSDKELCGLYDRFAKTTSQVAGREPAFAAHTYGVLRILWPARRWPENIKPPILEHLTAEERAYRNVAALEMQVTSLRGAFSGRQADRHLLKVWQLINTVADSVAAQVSLVEHVRELVRGTEELNPSRKPNEYASARFLTMHPIRLLESVSDEEPLTMAKQPAREGGSGAAPVCDVYQGIRNLVGYAVATQMRARSEAIGRLGLRQTLLTLSRGLQQTRFHLVGHSFGARAVLSAVDAPIDSGEILRPKTITILQGALPKNAFAPASNTSEAGFFHSVLAEGKAGGPILVTYSVSDESAGLPYAIAERIVEHSQKGKDEFQEPVAPMAQDGATDTGAVQLALNGRVTTRWNRGMVANLNGYGVIANHADVCKPEVVQAILSAATTTT
jgi:hypothetical protein